MAFHGTLEAIYIADDGAAPMRAVADAKAVAGVGIEGDRYATGAGTFWDADRPHGQITLIEAEAVEAAAAESGLAISAADTRRNLVTRGVPLNHLVGRTFAVSGVVLRGVKLCEPCAHVEDLSGKAIRKPLVHRGGLNAVIVSDGPLRPGDRIAVQEDAA